ncbi:NIPSNAP family protein [Deinococcus frigens]|uniref:NIPSNAP family protein n=1 Tax=Deinococcus frigens TaxID=249403 RepID=UPI000495925E|nr:NIPSNAP family protein [Deinococcus frigens]
MAPITCFLTYEVKAERLAEFEVYGRKWIELITSFGGQHHGYFLPSEGASDAAYALFTFPSLADYERYREESMEDPLCQELFAELPHLIERYDRTFLKPVLNGLEP